MYSRCAALILIAGFSAAAPVPRSKSSPGVIVFSTMEQGTPVLLSFEPSGTPKDTVAFPEKSTVLKVRLNPDRRTAALTELGDLRVKANVQGTLVSTLRILDATGGRAEPVTVAENLFDVSAAWSPDGRRLYYSAVNPDFDGKKLQKGEVVPFRTWAYDTARGESTVLDLPPEHAVADVSPNGKTLLTTTTEFGTEAQEIHTVPLDTMKPEKLFGPRVEWTPPRYSPDGKRVVLIDTSGPNGKTATRVVIVDVSTRTETPVNLPTGSERRYQEVCWSPDGRRLAVKWFEVRPPDYPYHVTICDTDGSNAIELAKRPTLSGLDWR